MGVGLASDRALRVLINEQFKELVITPPPEDDCIQPASIDLHLANEVAWLSPVGGSINPQKPPPLVRKVFRADEKILLPAGSFMLGSTVERVKLSRKLVGVVDGKSSLGRCGLSVHITAGYVDSGYDGNITLELKNETQYTIELTPGMKICQFRVYELEMPCARPYGSEGLGSHYVGFYGEGTVGPRA